MRTQRNTYFMTNVAHEPSIFRCYGALLLHVSVSNYPSNTIDVLACPQIPILLTYMSVHTTVHKLFVVFSVNTVLLAAAQRYQHLTATTYSANNTQWQVAAH